MRTRSAHDVEDGVEDLAEGVHPRASGVFGGRKMGLYVGPLGIGEVGLVCSSHARYSTELLPPDTFSDSFSMLDFSHLGTSKVRMPVAYPLKRSRIRGTYGFCPDPGKEVRSAPK